MDITPAKTRHADHTQDHGQELGRATRHGLVLAVGKKAAQQALRHARARARAAGRRRLVHAAGHVAWSGMLLAVIWHQRRAPKRSAAGA